MLVIGLQSVVMAVAREARERSPRKIRIGREGKRIQSGRRQDLPWSVGVQIDSEVAHGVPNVAHLNRVVVGELILRRYVVALCVWRLVVEVLTDQRNPTWFHGARGQRNRRKTVEDGADLPIGEYNRRIRHQVRKVQVELERKVVVSQQRRVFKP